MLKIIGRDTSSNVQKVLWICSEIGLPFEREDLGGPFGGNDTPEYRALNPNGRVPTIIDDGFVLWESNSCIRYLAAKHAAGTLCPDDLQIRANAERWMDWQIATVSPTLVPVFWGMVRTAPEDRDLDAIESARQKLTANIAIMDNHLANSTYMGGDNFTVGDIPLGITAYRWFNMEIDREPYHNVQRWYDLLCERSAFQEHVMNPMA
ncbi:MAG: glutathione S-transferase [Rhodospirillaceae bacterium]|nr:glutathione S-transferase [Rhodospirillaceae bacterium]|tara:strand:- start:14923 stop:15543 length:621 start_codon:yes stop_codon:yes gene_type:complete